MLSGPAGTAGPDRGAEGVAAMATTTIEHAQAQRPRPASARKKRGRSSYPYWFYLPAGLVFLVLFLVPTFASFFFSLTRWTLFDYQFIGLDNYVTFFSEPALVKGLTNTLIYAVVTSTVKVVLGMLLAVLLTSQIIGRGFLRSVVFFPVLVSTIGVGLTFTALMDPEGLINNALAVFGIEGPGWLTNPSIALLSVALVDIWKGVGLATVIFIAGIVSIPGEYFEAAKMDGATALDRFRHIILPLARPATVTVIILSLIGGLRSFDLIWTMTRGGPGFTSDVIASVIYKQYQAGFYGLSTAGNVVLFLLVTAMVLPLFWFLNRREDEL
jgi:raffinose/stachyose/melibiose transport system permease protein